ncbi:MAG: hypothetical protein FWE47_00930 [Oscillospiraceae bacterium]|nr:hypothetical protein [Oscillospiraceae bacterium]
MVRNELKTFRQIGREERCWEWFEMKVERAKVFGEIQKARQSLQNDLLMSRIPNIFTGLSAEDKIIWDRESDQIIAEVEKRAEKIIQARVPGPTIEKEKNFSIYKQSK